MDVFSRALRYLTTLFVEVGARIELQVLIIHVGHKATLYMGGDPVLELLKAIPAH